MNNHKNRSIDSNKERERKENVSSIDIVVLSILFIHCVFLYY